jgi:hypothetical protein
MDFAYINLLLDVVHKSLNLPNTGRIRDAAMAELTAINAPTPVPTVTKTAPIFPAEPELTAGGRRL